MMKTLMSATALTALVAATSAFAQTQEPAANPFTSDLPAVTEPTPNEEMEPAPATGAPSMTPAAEAETTTPELPPTQAVVPTLPPPGGAPLPPEQANARVEMFIQQQAPGEVLASSLIGSTVENPTGESLGDINDVVLSDQGTIDGIVIGVGGFLGIGEKDVAVNFDAIEKTVDADGNIVLTLNTTAEELEAAPQYVTVAGLRQQADTERNPPDQEPVAPAPSQ
jgi:sporulation protein YlmC with PRC-barrel domain